MLATVETNLLGPIRMSSALIGHLKRQPRAAIVNNTSVLASGREEALVEQAIPMRNNAGPDEHKFIDEFNAYLAANPIPMGA